MTEQSDKLLYIVRHGQSESNRDRMYQTGDVPLTELGHEQARFVADRLLHIPDLEIVISSPYTRALETARAIAETTKLPLEQDERIREYRVPAALMGTSFDGEEAGAYWDAQVEHYAEPGWRYADEENYDDLYNRADAFIHALEERTERSMVMVSHAGFTRVLLTHMMYQGERQPRAAQQLSRFLIPEHTGITICRYRPSETKRLPWRMLTWNDTVHLGDTDLRPTRD